MVLNVGEFFIIQLDHDIPNYRNDVPPNFLKDPNVGPKMK
jgi:hypothetical protein